MRRLLTLSMATVLSLSTVSVALGADPGELRERDAAKEGRARAAEVLGRKAADLRPLTYDEPVTSVGGRRYWTGLFRGRGDEQAFVAVDLESGETLDAAAYQAKVERAIGREPKVTPPARTRIDQAKRSGASPLLAYVLAPVDYTPAIKAVKAAHPEVEWDGDRPVGDDLEALAAVSQELIRAKVKLVAKQRGPFLEDARRRGASDVVSLDLAPMVFARVPSAQVDALAEHKSVRQVRAPAGWEPTMNTAHNAVGANWTDSKGYTGGGVVVGVVEYARVDYSRPGLRRYAPRQLPGQLDRAVLRPCARDLQQRRGHQPRQLGDGHRRRARLDVQGHRQRRPGRRRLGRLQSDRRMPRIHGSSKQSTARSSKVARTSSRCPSSRTMAVGSRPRTRTSTPSCGITIGSSSVMAGTITPSRTRTVRGARSAFAARGQRGTC